MARGVGLMRWYTDGYLQSIGQPGTNFLPVFRPGAGPLYACGFRYFLGFPAQTIPVTLPLLDNTEPLTVTSDGYGLEFAGGGPGGGPAATSYSRYRGGNCAAAVQWGPESSFWSQTTPPPPEGSPFGWSTGAGIRVNQPTQPKWTGSGDDDEGIWEARAHLTLEAESAVPAIPGVREARWCGGSVSADFALRAAAPRHRVRDGILLEAPDGVEPTFEFWHGYPTYDDEYWGTVRTRFESHLRSAFTGQLMPFIAMRLTLPDVAPHKEDY